MFLFASAIVTAVVGVVTPLLSDMPREVLILTAGITGVAGIGSAYLGLRPGAHVEDVLPGHRLMPPTRSSGVSAFWLGATMIFAVLSLAFAPAALVMILTGLLAFKRRKAAAGVALALSLAILVCVAVFLVLLGVTYEEPTSYYQYCLDQGYPAEVCADL